MSTVADLLAGPGWGRVSLDEAARRAALLDRQETKYVAPAEALAPALAGLAGRVDVLEIDGRTDFAYETVYYDTAGLLAYHQHAQGRRLRFKVRSRCYLDSGLCFVEVKLKGPRGRTVKERMPYDRGRHGSLDREAGAFVRACVRRTYGDIAPHHLEPALTMRYRRTTLVGRGGPERVTLDHGLAFAGPGGTVVAAPPTTMIVEVKSPTGRGVADDALRRAGVRGERCSKYCIGLNLVRPDLPYNRFKRPLARHFAWPGRTGRPGPPPATRPGGR